MARTGSKGPSPVIVRRLRQCRAEMKRHGISAFLITAPRDEFYLSGFTGEDSAVLIQPRAVHVISDGRFEEAINQECPWVRRWMRKGLLPAEIARACEALGLNTLAIQPEHLSLADHKQLRKLVRPARLVEAPAIVARMRKYKDDSELRTMRRAIRVAEEAFAAARESIRVGQTERQIAARIEFEMKQRGASGASFATIVAEGPNAALPHAHPGERKVRRGSALLLDWGARVHGYCSDLTRMLFIGSISTQIERVYEIVLDAQVRAIRAIRPGRRMCDVDAVARDYIREHGLGERFNHGLGHGLGLDVHEAPSLSWRSDEALEADMVVTVEPGVYLPGIGGVRIEDDVLVTPTGARVLTRIGKSLRDALIR